MRPEGREPLPDKAGESTLLSRSGGEKGLRGSVAGKARGMEGRGVGYGGSSNSEKGDSAKNNSLVYLMLLPGN